MSSLVLNLFASQIEEFFMPHPVHDFVLIRRSSNVNTRTGSYIIGSVERVVSCQKNQCRRFPEENLRHCAYEVVMRVNPYLDQYTLEKYESSFMEFYTWKFY